MLFQNKSIGSMADLNPKKITQSAKTLDGKIILNMCTKFLSSHRR